MISGTIYLANSSQTTGGGYLVGKIAWQATANLASNTSEVSATLYVKKEITGSSVTTPTVGTWECNLSIGESSTSQAVNKQVSGEFVPMLSKTVTAAHNPDGGRTLNISGTAWGPSGTKFSGKSTSGGDTVMLETIVRSSSLEFDTLTLDAQNSITITAQQEGFRHDVYLSCGGKSVCMLHDVLQGSYGITPRLQDFGAQITKSQTATGILTLYTYNSDWTALLSTVQYTAAIQVPESAEPNIDSVTIQEAAQDIPDGIDVFVQGKSKFSIQVSASGQYGADVQNIAVTVEGRTYTGSSITTGVLTSAGTASIAVAVTDSRGLSKRTTKEITVEPYTPPQITKFSAYRVTPQGAASETGERLALDIAYTRADVAGENDSTLCIDICLPNGSWQTCQQTAAEQSFTGTLQFLQSPELSVDNSYQICAKLQDQFTVITAYTMVPTSASVLDFHASGLGVAVGKASEEESLFDCAWDIQGHGSIAAAGTVRAGEKMEIGTASALGGYLDFHHNGFNATATARIIEESAGNLTVQGNCNLQGTLSLQSPLSIANGGTGTGEQAALSRAVLNAGEQNANLSAYPNQAGIYRTVGTDVFANLSEAHGVYGVLAVLAAGYGMHVYTDEYGRLFYGRSGDLAEPDSWGAVDAVLEEGSAGIWNYRKYASGRLECLGSQTYSGAASSSWGSLYALLCTAPDYPIDFSDWPNVQRDVLLNTGSGCWLAAWDVATQQNCGQFALVRPNNQTINATVKFRVTGHWR